MIGVDENDSRKEDDTAMDTPRFERALKLMPREDLTPMGYHREVIRSAWSDALRKGCVIELPVYRKDIDSLLIKQRDAGIALIEGGAVEDPFQHPWITVQKREATNGDGKKEWVAEAGLYIALRGKERGFMYAGFELSSDRPQFSFILGGVEFFDQDEVKYFASVGEAFETAGVSAETQKIARESFTNPYYAAVGFLNTRGVEYETRETKIDRKTDRIKRTGRIRPSGSYFTAIHANKPRKARGEHGGGTHASPLPHVRCGHTRTLADGKKVLVRPCLVNVPSEGELAFLERNRYVIK